MCGRLSRRRRTRLSSRARPSEPVPRSHIRLLRQAPNASGKLASLAQRLSSIRSAATKKGNHCRWPSLVQIGRTSARCCPTQSVADRATSNASCEHGRHILCAYWAKPLLGRSVYIALDVHDPWTRQSEYTCRMGNRHDVQKNRRSRGPFLRHNLADRARARFLLVSLASREDVWHLVQDPGSPEASHGQRCQHTATIPVDITGCVRPHRRRRQRQQRQ